MGSIEMKILIKGAGDLATGIASRLYGAGHQIMMTDIAVPLTVRRLVAFSRAVYEGEAVVEDMTARLAKNQEEAEEIMEQGDIPVIVDPKAECIQWFQPDVIVDAILAKRNLGTKITDAPFVIGVGPGFTAGEDVDVVIETMRGHSLGRCIYDGPAQPNTGIPGNVGGYTHERVIHSPKAGLFTAKRHIGDSVQANEVIGYVDEEPVRAKITGILRGILKSGLIVSDHFKLADVDARCEESHCYSISDKSLAVGGGVLEAVTAWDYERNLDGNNL